MDSPTNAADIAYDADADVLYVSFGPPTAATGSEVEPGIILRLAPETEHVVGITIEGFRERFGGARIEALFDLARRLPMCQLPEQIREHAHG